MTASVVQSASANTTVTPATVTLPGSPTAGNTLLAIMASDTTSSAVPFAGSGNTFTQRLAQVGGMGFYVWTRLVVSGDSATITFTPNGANAASLMVLEIQGTYDKISTGLTTGGSAALSRTTNGLSPATTDNIVIAIAGGHAITSAAGSGGAADNGFTLARAQFSATTGGTQCMVVSAYKVTGATTATGTTTVSWTTGPASDRDGVQVGFTGIAGSPAVTADIVMGPRAWNY